MRYQLIQTKNNLPNWKCLDSGQTIHSNYDPVKESNRVLQSFLTNISPSTKILFIFGCGWGYHIEELLNSSTALLYIEQIYCYEPILDIVQNPIFEERKRYLSSITKSVNVIFISELPSKPNKSFSIWVHPYYQKNFPQELTNFKNKLFASVNINQSTINHFQKLWLRNSLIHLNSMIDGKKVNLFSNKELYGKIDRVLFCGASPFLEEQLDSIYKIRKSVFLISSDTSAFYLVSMGIIPDLIASVDSGRGTYYHFRKTLLKSIPILTWLGGNREIWERGNPIVLYFSSYPVDQLFRNYLGESNFPQIENPSLNVAGLAKGFAKLVGASQLVFAGVDFQAQSRKTHCRGTGYELYNLDKINRYTNMEQFSSKVYTGNISKKNQNSFNKIFQDEDLKLSVIPISQLDIIALAETAKPISKIDFLQKDYSTQTKEFYKLLSSPSVQLAVSKEINTPFNSRYIHNLEW